MKRVLLTGLSGTGKSSVIRELSARGYRAVDLDTEEYSQWVNQETGQPAPPPALGEYPWEELDWVWRVDRVRDLLSAEDAELLFVSGTAINQGKFRGNFDVIILLSAPSEVMVERLTSRPENAYGSSPAERDRVMEHIETVEPLLRNAANHEIDTSAPLDEVVERVLTFVGKG